MLGFVLLVVVDMCWDGDWFDEYCDYLLVCDDDIGELVGCYWMLVLVGVIVVGGFYIVMEFDVCVFDLLWLLLVEMGCVVVCEGYCNGGVVLLMWVGILVYLD